MSEPSVPSSAREGLVLGGLGQGPAPDRASDRRRDEAWVQERWAEPDTRVLVVAGGELRLADGRPAWTTAEQAPDGVRVLLGRQDGRWHFAVLRDTRTDDDGDWVTLRGAMGALAAGDRRDLPLVFHAVGIAQWQLVTRFCPRDGQPLASGSAGHELRCPHGHPQFPRSDPAVIMLITDGAPGDDERALLGRSPAWPPGRYSTLAGFVEPGETLEDAVRREVAEETSVVVGEVRYLGSQPWPLPASLMLGFRGRAADATIAVDGREIEDARWLTRDELRAGVDSGELVLPGGLSISHALIEDWYGAPIASRW